LAGGFVSAESIRIERGPLLRRSDPGRLGIQVGDPLLRDMAGAFGVLRVLPCGDERAVESRSIVGDEWDRPVLEGCPRLLFEIGGRLGPAGGARRKAERAVEPGTREVCR